MPLDTDVFVSTLGDELADIVRGCVARAIDPLLKRIEDLQRRLESAPTPKDGKDAEPEQIREAVTAEVARAVAELPKAKDGENGKDALPVDPESIAAMVREAVAAIPAPKDGRDGKDAPELDPQAVAAALLPLVPPPKVGATGKSVTVDDVRPLIAEEVAKAAALIPKPKDGESVPIEDVVRMVDDAVREAVAAIPVAKDGEPGRDAAHLEILSAIDAAKSYPRGTYAKHANGFWRAFERTDGMRGWECLVAGLAAVSVARAHEREYTHTFTLSDGTVVVHKESIPVAIYRGVFVEGRTYEPGDQVSWGAHQWHCNEATTEKPIEGGKSWTLSVKRGRDGKEGPPGPKWTPPAPIPIAGNAAR